MSNTRRDTSGHAEEDAWDRKAEADIIHQFDVAKELPRSVYRVPDGIWGFHAEGRMEHPGVCVSVNPQSGTAFMLKGTDAQRAVARWRTYVVVNPDATNRLSKPTAFALEPRRFRIRKIVLLHHDRKIGSLASADFERLQSELRRVFSTPECG